MTFSTESDDASSTRQESAETLSGSRYRPGTWVEINHFDIKTIANIVSTSLISPSFCRSNAFPKFSAAFVCNYLVVPPCAYKTIVIPPPV